MSVGEVMCVLISLLEHKKHANIAQMVRLGMMRMKNLWINASIRTKKKEVGFDFPKSYR